MDFSATVATNVPSFLLAYWIAADALGIKAGQ
jgi:hypothetical protein